MKIPLLNHRIILHIVQFHMKDALGRYFHIPLEHDTELCDLIFFRTDLLHDLMLSPEKGTVPDLFGRCRNIDIRPFLIGNLPDLVIGKNKNHAAQPDHE